MNNLMCPPTGPASPRLSRTSVLPWFLGALVFCLLPAWAADRKTQNILLITIDGVRIEEMFGGFDVKVVQATTKEKRVEEEALYQKYWAPTPEARRMKLMPFFWGTLMARHGSIAGNPEKSSRALLSNRHRFSYPGYSELLTGKARDEVIQSNDKNQNPFPTVLEFFRKELQLTSSQAAVFACWDVMNWIAEREPGALTINAGFEAYEHPDPGVQLLSKMQFETRTPWDSVRHDAYTFRFAMAHFRTHHPRVFYLSLGETDDWAHDKRYDRVLQALEHTDRYLAELWDFLQSDAVYRDKTTIILTTDHGRGNNEYTWPNHGAKIEGAQDIWIAFISPDSSLRGEWANTETIHLNQVAATLSQSLGLNFNASHPEAGQPISRLFDR